jgi:flagellar capping protein FliD
MRDRIISITESEYELLKTYQEENRQIKEKNKELMNILIKKLEKDINDYFGDYGTLERRVEQTFYQILNILKVMNGEVPFEDWFLEEILKGGSNEN